MTAKLWFDEYSGQSISELLALKDSHRIDSILVAIEAALQKKERLSYEEWIVVAVEALEREVNNGGYEQFFLNSSNEYAGFIVSALEAIGCLQVATITSRALQAIGASDKWEPSDYESAATEADADVLETLQEIDEEYYSCPESIEQNLFTFVDANRARIVLP
jgi:hypothetical protein